MWHVCMVIAALDGGVNGSNPGQKGSKSESKSRRKSDQSLKAEEKNLQAHFGGKEYRNTERIKNPVTGAWIK